MSKLLGGLFLFGFCYMQVNITSSVVVFVSKAIHYFLKTNTGFCEE